MFVQSVEFIRAHATGNGNGGKARADISIYNQESNYTTWRLAKMSLANPPFNVSDWGGERLREDQRWRFGVPPVKNANFAWVQHIIHRLAPTGTAGFVLANGSMSSAQSGEGEICKHGHVLTPGRYVGAEEKDDDGEPFEEKMMRLVALLREQQAQAAMFDAAIAKNLKEIGFWEMKP